MWVVAVLALLFGPALLADGGGQADAKALSAAALAPTLSSADVARVEAVTEGRDQAARPAPTLVPISTAPAAALLLVAALAVPLVLGDDRGAHLLGWRRRGPPLLPA